MTAKEFLLQYREAAEKIRMLEREVEQLETAASGGAIVTDGQPHGSPGKDRLGDMAAAAADRQKELREWYDWALAAKWRVVEVLSRLKDADQIAVLRERYTAEEWRGWQYIADELGKSVRQVQRIHGQGLIEVQLVIDAEPELVRF